MRKFFVCAILILILSACGNQSSGAKTPTGSEAGVPPAAQTVEPTPILPPALEGDLEIQQLMLTSSQRWKALQATYQLTIYPTDGSGAEAEVKRHQIWIRLPAEFKVEITNGQEATELIRVSNGVVILDNTGSRSDLPPSVLEPFNPPNTPSDTVTPYPLAGLLSTPVSDLIFPAGLAQRGGEYQITGKEKVAGRDASVVEWSREPGVLIDRLWVDQKTGVILRQQNYGKQNSTSPTMDFQATHIAFDPLFTDNMFDLAQVPEPTPTLEGPPPAAASATVLPQVLNVRSGPNTDYKVVATVESGKKMDVIGKTEAEDWWKVDLGDGSVGWVVALYVDIDGDTSKVPVVNY